MHPLIAEPYEKWRKVRESPSGSLLKVSILRDIYLTIHSQRASRLAREGSRSTADLDQLEKHLFRAVTFPIQKIKIGSLEKIPVGNPLPPQPLPSVLQPYAEKLEREDRVFERRMAMEAYALDWKFWILEESVPIRKVEEFHLHLGQTLWPQGLILFVEQGEASTEKAKWSGRWWLLLEGDPPENSQCSRLF